MPSSQALIRLAILSIYLLPVSNVSCFLQMHLYFLLKYVLPVAAKSTAHVSDVANF